MLYIDICTFVKKSIKKKKRKFMCHCCVFCMMVNSVVISLLLIICVLENLKLSFLLYWKSENLIFVVLKIWNSHFCCTENLKLSFFVLKIWNSLFFVLVPLHVGKLSVTFNRRLWHSGNLKMFPIIWEELCYI